MKIILLQDVPKIGKKFEIKDVSNGYAINFLLPRKLGKLATNQAIKELEVEKKKYEDKKEVETKELKVVIEKLAAPIKIEVKTNKEGKLFAGLDKKEIGEAIQKEAGIKIDPNIIELDKPIKEIGEYEIGIKIAGEKTKLIFKIKSEEE